MIGVAGKPTTTTPTPRFNISRLKALDMEKSKEKLNFHVQPVSHVYSCRMTMKRIHVQSSNCLAYLMLRTFKVNHLKTMTGRMISNVIQTSFSPKENNS